MNATFRKGIAARVVKAIVADILDRRGIGQEFGAIDLDIRREITKGWRKVIEDELKAFEDER